MGSRPACTVYVYDRKEIGLLDQGKILTTAPQTKDQNLLTVKKRGLQLSAKPYAGPQRPKLRHEQ
ncbi:hypothetical protein GX408_05520 [bacterium]|nr:hypothetical protein [bacterium]